MSLESCIHPDRPQNSSCTHCGLKMCYQCYISDTVRAVEVSRTSIDASIKRDVRNFCAACFLDRIMEPDYYLLYVSQNGSMHKISPHQKPTLISLRSWGYSQVGAIVYTILIIAMLAFFGMGLIIFLFMIPDYNRAKETYEEFQERKDRAYAIFKEQYPESNRTLSTSSRMINPTVRQQPVRTTLKSAAVSETDVQEINNPSTSVMQNSSTTKFCIHCGDKRKDFTAKFCTTCGKEH